MPRRSRLISLSSVVVLDLAKVPHIRIEHREEVRRTAVVRKTDLANAPRSLLARNPVLDAQRHHTFPLGGRGNVVHEVIVDMVGPQAAQLLIEEPVEILRTLARSMRQLGRQQHPVTQPQSFKRSAHARLVAGIEIGRVQVVNPLLHRTGDDSVGGLRIGVSRRTGKPHAAQTQSGYSVTTFGVNTVLHGPSLRHQRPGKAKHNGHAAETSWNRNRERIVTQQKSSRHGTALTSAKSPMKGAGHDHAHVFAVCPAA